MKRNDGLNAEVLVGMGKSEFVGYGGDWKRVFSFTVWELGWVIVFIDKEGGRRSLFGGRLSLGWFFGVDVKICSWIRVWNFGKSFVLKIVFRNF